MSETQASTVTGKDTWDKSQGQLDFIIAKLLEKKVPENKASDAANNLVESFPSGAANTTVNAAYSLAERNLFEDVTELYTSFPNAGYKPEGA